MYGTHCQNTEIHTAASVVNLRRWGTLGEFPIQVHGRDVQYLLSVSGPRGIGAWRARSVGGVAKLVCPYCWGNSQTSNYAFFLSKTFFPPQQYFRVQSTYSLKRQFF